MKIDKAIEINESLLDGTYDHRDEDMEDALKLGIEALKAIRDVRPTGYGAIDEPLPGETED